MAIFYKRRSSTHEHCLTRAVLYWTREVPNHETRGIPTDQVSDQVTPQVTPQVRSVPKAVVQLPAPKKVQQPAAQLPSPADPLLWSIPWGHHALLLARVKDPSKRRRYMAQTLANGWSRDVLALAIDTCLHCGPTQGSIYARGDGAAGRAASKAAARVPSTREGTGLGCHAKLLDVRIGAHKSPHIDGPALAALLTASASDTGDSGPPTRYLGRQYLRSGSHLMSETRQESEGVAAEPLLRVIEVLVLRRMESANHLLR